MRSKNSHGNGGSAGLIVSKRRFNMSKDDKARTPPPSVRFDKFPEVDREDLRDLLTQRQKTQGAAIHIFRKAKARSGLLLFYAA